jgi:hypothetical protein
MKRKASPILMGSPRRPKVPGGTNSALSVPFR